MSDLPETLVRKLVEKYRNRYQTAKPDALKLEVRDDSELDKANFDGDYDALWEAVKAGIRAEPKPVVGAEGNVRSGSGGSVREEKEFIPDPWQPSDNELLTAPYRFAALSPYVSNLADDERETSLARPKNGLFSAVLDVTWAIETPILIGDRHGEDAPDAPFRLGDDWAIPGATLRGTIRSVLETAAFGRLFQTNRHRRFALRDFDHPYYRDFIKKAVNGLKAGWLTQTTDGPAIQPCDWGYLRIEDLIGSDADNDIKAWASKDRAGKYGASDWQSKDAFTATRSFAYVETDKSGRKIYKAGSGKTGVAVYSGRIPGGRGGKPKKRFEYVFFDTAQAAVLLSEAAWETFELLNCKPSKNKREPDGAWADLIKPYKAGGKVPVFYMGDLARNDSDPDFSFGLTRLYRRPHRFSVGDLLERTRPDGMPDAKSAHLPGVETFAGGDRSLRLRPDFVEHLFGYVYEPDELEFGQSAVVKRPEYHRPSSTSRKGRVAFGFARAASGSVFRPWPDQAIATIMGAPKPSFAPFYTVGAEKDYSSEHARLAGRKRYIARYVEGDAKAELRAALEGQIDTPEKRRNTKVQSRLQFLAPDKGAAFTSRIKLRNVSASELGAVLWALTFGGDRDARHLIGRGKPFGAGQCRVAAIALHIRPIGVIAEETVNWRHEDGREGIGAWLDAFEARIVELAGLPPGRAFASREGVRDLLAAARPRGWKAPKSSYLPYEKPGQGGQAQDFSHLRKKTGAGAAKIAGTKPPYRLLEP